jgi:peptidoglycan/LPS O-acetylase OafA/YrhL
MQFFSSGFLWTRHMYQRIVQGIVSLLDGKKQKSTIASLDGVRAIACLIVIVYHLTLVTTQDLPLWSSTQFPQLFSALAYSGDTGVDLFFILSGFLLFMPYAKALLFDSQWPSMRKFYIKRALRILPAYYVTLVLMVIIFHPEAIQPRNLWNLFTFFILVKDSTPLAFGLINGPFWTLAVECQFYVILPILVLGIALIVRRKNDFPAQRLFLLALTLGGLIVWGIFCRYVGIYVSMHPDRTFHLPRSLLHAAIFLVYGKPTSGFHGRFIEDFALGMLISAFFIFASQKGPEHLFNRWLRWISPLLLGVSLLWFVAMAAWKYHLEKAPQIWPIFNHTLLLYNYVGRFGFSIAYGLFMVAILFGAGWLRRPFEWTPLRWFGIISFGLYMWHLLLLEAFTKYVTIHLYGRGWPNLVLYFLYWGWLFAFIIPCVLVLFAFVEKPGIQLGERLTRKKPSPPATPRTEMERRNHENVVART